MYFDLYSILSENWRTSTLCWPLWTWATALNWLTSRTL